MKIDLLNGGPPQVLCNAPNGEGGTWSSNGTILFAPSPTSGLFRVAADGGIATPVTMLDSGRKEVSHRWPWFLPDGRHFLYVTTGPTKMYVGSLDSQERVELLEPDSKALYSAGHLLFVRERTLLAQPFDAVRLTLQASRSRWPKTWPSTQSSHAPRSRPPQQACLRIERHQLADDDWSGSTEAAASRSACSATRMLTRSWN